MFTADVAVEDQDEIAQDVTPPVCSHIAKERFAGWWIFGSTVQLPQSVCVERPPKRQNYVTYHMVPCACFLLHEPEKNKKDTTTRTYSSKITTWILHGKNQIQPSGTTFSNLNDNVAAHTKIAVALPRVL